MGPAYVPYSLLQIHLSNPNSASSARDADVSRYSDAFIRDELSKGRYDPTIAKICFEMLLELFERTLKLDLGRESGGPMVVEDIC